jgi:hypothetical protein
MSGQTSGTVADGHVIHGPGGPYRPGDRFEAPAEEIARLIRIGHLVDPRRRVVARPDGVQLLYRAKEFVPR